MKKNKIVIEELRKRNKHRDFDPYDEENWDDESSYVKDEILYIGEGD